MRRYLLTRIEYGRDRQKYSTKLPVCVVCPVCVFRVACGRNPERERAPKHEGCEAVSILWIQEDVKEFSTVCSLVVPPLSMLLIHSWPKQIAQAMSRRVCFDLDEFARRN